MHTVPSFKDFSMSPSLQRAVDAMGFETPTPIQAKSIPVAMTGRDLIACAQTGSGKTAAFAIPILSKLETQPGSLALILVPTRELAAQISEVIKDLTRFLPEIRQAILIGGVAMGPQLSALRRGPRIVVATPGRLCDHLRRGTISLAKTNFLTLDEADRMLDMGFAPQLNEILRFLPKTRQTFFFSATFPANIRDLSRKYLSNPAEVEIDRSAQEAPKIEQVQRAVQHHEKNDALLDELNQREGTVLVFARTQARTDRVSRYLESFGVNVARIHGGRSQGQRTRALEGFRDGSYRVLVATDIAARGLDIDHVAHVVNYDLPNVPEDYVHRIGRTGRAGRTGSAISLIAPDDRTNWREIERLLKRNAGGQVVNVMKVGPSDLPAAQPLAQSDRPMPPQRPMPQRPRPMSSPKPMAGPRPAASAQNFEGQGGFKKEFRDRDGAQKKRGFGGGSRNKPHGQWGARKPSSGGNAFSAQGTSGRY